VSSTIAATDVDPVATATYRYTASGELSSVTTPTTTVDYKVDAQGLRQSRTTSGSTDEFVWSTVGSLPVLLDDGDHVYLYGPSLTPIAQVDDAGTIEYLQGDLLGSVRTITDSGGAVVGTSAFDAFGARTAHTGSADSAIGFTGNWTDPDTGLVHLRARDYDPATGQFLTVDPAVDDTRQPYAYVGNNPLLLTDPSGLDAWDDYIGTVWNSSGLGQSVDRVATQINAGTPWYEAVIWEYDPFSHIYNGVANLITHVNAGCGWDVISQDVLEVWSGVVGVAGFSFRVFSLVGKVGNTVRAADARAALVPPYAVIGKQGDLQDLTGTSFVSPRNHEYSLLSELPNQGSPRANWKQNSRVLRQEMRRHVPIKDASWRPGDGDIMVQHRNSFLGAERNLLNNHRWTFNPVTGFWYPPYVP
jgi:RHS repeat-associated protein